MGGKVCLGRNGRYKAMAGPSSSSATGAMDPHDGIQPALVAHGS